MGIAIQGKPAAAVALSVMMKANQAESSGD